MMLMLMTADDGRGPFRFETTWQDIRPRLLSSRCYTGETTAAAAVWMK